MVQLVNKLKFFLPLTIFTGITFFLIVALDRDPNYMPSTLLDRPVPTFSLSVLGNENEFIDEKIFVGRTVIAECMGDMVLFMQDRTSLFAPGSHYKVYE
jgi:hypothetical protein